MAEDELDSIKQQTPTNNFKTDDPMKFHIQIANGQLEKPTAIVTGKIDFEDDIYTKHFIVVEF